MKFASILIANLLRHTLGFEKIPFQGEYKAIQQIFDAVGWLGNWLYFSVRAKQDFLMSMKYRDISLVMI